MQFVLYIIFVYNYCIIFIKYDILFNTVLMYIYILNKYMSGCKQDASFIDNATVL